MVEILGKCSRPAIGIRKTASAPTSSFDVLLTDILPYPAGRFKFRGVSSWSQSMKLFPFFILSVILAVIIPGGMAQEATSPPKHPKIIDRTDPDDPYPTFLRYLGPSWSIGEGGGARLLLHCAHEPEMKVITFDHRLVAEASDGRQFILYEARSRAPQLSARMNQRGDVAVPSYPGLKIFFAPDYQPMEIRKLRSERFLKGTPKFTSFAISDLAWGQGMLACFGHFHIARDPSRPTRDVFSYPFVSRLFVDDTGEVRDHQILWTTWRPSLALPDKNSHSWQHHEANGIEGTLHVQGNLALWKNQGMSGGAYPAELPPGFEKAGWQCTDLTTGATLSLIHI